MVVKIRSSDGRTNLRSMRDLVYLTDVSYHLTIYALTAQMSKTLGSTSSRPR